MPQKRLECHNKKWYFNQRNQRILKKQQTLSKVVYSYWRITLTLNIYLINHVSVKTLNTGRMIPSVTNRSPAEILMKTQISNVVPITRFWNNLHQIRSKPKDYMSTYLLLLVQYRFANYMSTYLLLLVQYRVTKMSLQYF